MDCVGREVWRRRGPRLCEEVAYCGGEVECRFDFVFFLDILDGFRERERDVWAGCVEGVFRSLFFL